MCYNKIRVKNPNFKKDDPRSKRWLMLPCGQCEECRQLLTSAYAFRAQQETINCELLHGLVYFNTFTYNDDFLPRLRTKKCFISTWNKQHIQKFIKRLRRFFEYYFHINSKLIRYMITCERGSDRVYKDDHGRIRKATKRPHYHSIFWLYNADIEFTPFKTKKGDLVTLPDWCNGLVKLSDVFPLVFKHCWSDPDTYKSYGNIDDELVARTPALATKYITKYITKQLHDETFKLSLQNIIYHEQDIDKKDFQPFTLMSKGLGSSYIPVFEELTGEKKVVYQSSESHTSEIGLPRYYIKRICKRVLPTFTKKYTKVVNENWTAQDGYTPSKYIVFSDYELRDGYWFHDGRKYPIEYKTKSFDTEVGEQVKSRRFELSCDKFYDNIIKLVNNPLLYIDGFKKYSKVVHNDLYNMTFVYSITEDTLNPETLRKIRIALDSDEIYEVGKLSSDLVSRFLYAVTVIRAHLEPDEIDSILGFDPHQSLKEAIVTYLHDDTDTSSYLHVALDIIYTFFSDLSMIISGVKRYCNAQRYKNNKTKVMVDHADLFKPHELDYNFSDIDIVNI